MKIDLFWIVLIVFVLGIGIGTVFGYKAFEEQQKADIVQLQEAYTKALQSSQGGQAPKGTTAEQPGDKMLKELLEGTKYEQ